jgi:hypothetical protein
MSLDMPLGDSMVSRGTNISERKLPGVCAFAL